MPTSILEQLPTLMLYAIAGTVAFVILGYLLAAKRPATKGQIIGHYTFHIWGVDSIEGLTSLGQDILQDEAFTKLFWLATKKANPCLPEDEFKSFKAKLQQFQVYGVRKGLKKYLIVANENIRTPEIGEAPPSERRKFNFPHGWLDRVHVYGLGKGPLHFKGYDVYAMAPVNIQKGQPDLATFQGMEYVAKAVGIIETGMPMIDEFKALREERGVLEAKFRESEQKRAENTHDKSILLDALAQKPLGGAETKAEDKGFQFPKFHISLTQAALTFISFVAGVVAIPHYYPQMEAFTGGLIMAISIFIIVGFLKKK
jgi:hypothetical protein